MFRFEYLMTTCIAMLFGFSALMTFSGLVYSLFTCFLFYLYFAFQVCFPILIAIRQLISNKYGKKSQNEVFKGVSTLLDPKYQEIFNLFEKYAASEFSVENLYIKKDIRNFLENPSKRQEIATFIYLTYLNGEKSFFEVNLEKRLCEEIQSHILKKEFSENLFVEVEKEVDKNLSDTFSRFRFQNDYFIALKSIEFQDNELKF
jgi:hypothetical protein